MIFNMIGRKSGDSSSNPLTLSSVRITTNASTTSSFTLTFSQSGANYYLIVRGRQLKRLAQKSGNITLNTYSTGSSELIYRIGGSQGDFSSVAIIAKTNTSADITIIVATDSQGDNIVSTVGISLDP